MAAATSGSRGHRLLPHTADLIVRAWAPTAELCLGEAVGGLVESCAEVPNGLSPESLTFGVDPGSPAEQLIAVLDQVIYLIDTRGVIPVGVAMVWREPEGGLLATVRVVPVEQVEVVGPAPKAVSRHDLRFHRDRNGWRCQVTIDV